MTFAPTIMRLLIPAILILASCSDSKPKARPTEELRQSVQAAIKAEDYTKAEKELSELVAQDPKSFDSLIGRAAVRIFLGDADPAFMSLARDIVFGSFSLGIK